MTVNTSPRNYNTHSTSTSIKAYLTQSQPKVVTKEILPTKKNSHFNNFSTKTG